jgi:ribosomal protein L37AE/L43A
MKILNCPHCTQKALFSTGALWSCANCGYAITGAALFVDLTASEIAQVPERAKGGMDRMRR